MFCPHCGKEFAPESNFCSACGKAPGFDAGPYRSARIVRPRSRRLIAGVLSGFALHYGWDLVVTRILYVVLTIFTFPLGLIVYLAAWLLMPDAQYGLPAGTPSS